MLLTGRQLKQLQEALLSAYRSRASLERMLLFGMSVRLPSIAGEGNLADVIFEVLQWAEAEGRTAELLEVAARNNGGNALLILAVQDLSPVLAREAALPREPPTADRPVAGAKRRVSRASAAVDRGRLRAAVEKAFNATELALLCANVQEALAARGIDLPVSVEDVGGATKSVQVLNLVTYLERRGHLTDLVAAVQDARPGLLEDI